MCVHDDEAFDKVMRIFDRGLHQADSLGQSVHALAKLIERRACSMPTGQRRDGLFRAVMSITQQARMLEVADAVHGADLSLAWADCEHVARNVEAAERTTKFGAQVVAERSAQARGSKRIAEVGRAVATAWERNQ